MPQVGAKVNVNSGGGGGSGITQLTGDVIAGPGSGVKAATLVATAAVKALIASWSAVTSVFGRTGAVTAQSGDYNATQVPNVVVSVTQAAAPAMDTDNGTVFECLNLAQAMTSLTTNLTGTPVDGQEINTIFSDNGTARALTFGAKFVTGGSGASLPTTTTVGGYLFIRWMYSSALSAWVYQFSNTSSSGGALTTASGVLGADYNLSAASTLYTWLATASLAVGTWLLTVNAIVDSTGNANFDIGVAQGTATATFAGPQVAGILNQYNYATMGSFTCIVTVTVAGTLVLQVESSVGSGNSAAVKAATALLARSVASGYTAVKVG